VTEEDKVKKIELQDYILMKIESNDLRYEQRFLSSQQALNAALESASTAVIKAETATEKRFDSVNEFRATLADQQRTYMPRSEVDIIIKNLEERVSINANQISTLVGQKSGRTDQTGYILAILGGISTIVTVILYVVKP